MLDKAVRYLERARTDGTFWFDKWHASPYYTTGHAILALRDHPELTLAATRWTERTQRADGSWGHYGTGTAEETAYAVQALACQRQRGYAVDPRAVQRGAAFLERSPERRARAYTPLWIGKTLYTPPIVVHSTVIGALALVEEVEGGRLSC
jgi:halimadienyl-diphosphate synthase